jgi:hypothetical protein
MRLDQITSGRVEIIEPGHMPLVKQCVRKEVRSAKAARTPGQTAGTATATSATTAAATTAPATAAASAAAATATTPRDLHVAAGVFLVEEMEGRQTDVRDFFLTKRDGLGRREAQFLRRIESGGGRR